MILQAVVGGFVLDTSSATRRGCPTRWCSWARPSPAGKAAARPPAQNACRENCWAVPCGVLPAGGHLAGHEPCVSGAAKLSPWLGLAVQMFWCGQALAAKGLAQESTNVYNELVRTTCPPPAKP